MILVDSSVWIEYFRSKSHPHAKALDEIILENATSIVLCDIVLAEVLRGIRSDDAFEEIKDFLVPYVFFSPCTLETYIQAALLYRKCRKHGVTIRSFSDSLIATIALINKVPLWTLDKDFKKIQKIAPLKLYTPDQ